VLSLKSLFRSMATAWPDLERASRSSVCCMSVFFLGVCLTLSLPKLPYVPWLLMVSSTVGLASFHFVYLRAIFFLLLGFTWACYSFQSFISTQFPDDYERVDFIASGAIEDLPVSRAGNVQFRYKIDAVGENDLSMLIGKTIQLSCYRCPLTIRAGQRWRFTLRLKRPHGYASWGVFDYEKYLFRHRVIAKGYVRLKGDKQFLGVTPALIHPWRESLLSELRGIAGDGVGSNIIAALTIGVKSGFSNQQRQVLQTTGVSHLMAISGLHVGLVFIGVALLLKWLVWPIAGIFERHPRPTLVLLPALAAATSYAALAGFSVSTQRALVMLVVYVLCKFFARDATLIKVLLIAIVVLLLADPFSILDIGFWLSCGAVAIIALISTGDEKLSLLRLQPNLWLGMLPLSIIFFGQVSLISPLVNLIVVPIFCVILIPLTLLVVLMFSLGVKTVGAWCLIELSSVFELIFQVLESVSHLEYAKIYATPLVWWQWLILLLLLFFYLCQLRRRWVLVTILLVSVFAKTSAALTKDELHVTLLDVGQGLAMVIETPNSVTVYDTGPRYGTGFTAAQAVLLPFLRQRGIRRIDTLVISHADNDHIGGLQVLRDAFEINRTISSRLDKVVGAEECVAGQIWEHDQTTFSVISPQLQTPNGSNNRSCVIMLEHLGTKILLSGDIEKQVERFLVRRYKQQLKADVLLVPHQGSKTSSTAKFLDAVSPNLAMLAAGYKNHYGHPHAQVVNRYRIRDIDLLSTIESGSVLLKINSQGWAKVAYRQRYRRFWNYQKLPNKDV